MKTTKRLVSNYLLATLTIGTTFAQKEIPMPTEKGNVKVLIFLARTPSSRRSLYLQQNHIKPRIHTDVPG